MKEETSNHLSILSGALQGSIIGPDAVTTPKTFADDIATFVTHKNPVIFFSNLPKTY